MVNHTVGELGGSAARVSFGTSRIWRWPLLLAALSLFGLLSALLGEGGVWWVLSWIALAAPLAVIASCLSRRRPTVYGQKAQPPSDSTTRGAGSARSVARVIQAWMRARHRILCLLLALGVHGFLVTLVLLPQSAEPSMTSPVPIQTQIITEPRVQPAPPPLKPVSLTLPRMQFVVPAPIISVAETSTLLVATQPAPSASVPVTTASNAPLTPPVPVSPPTFDAAYLHNAPPEYPLQSRRRHEQGTVMLRVEVSAGGNALQVLIDHSSGWLLLDQAAVGAVRRWRFEPARLGRDPVVAWVLVPIEFGLRS